MKILIITVAGMSTRFSQSLGQSCLKCIYYSQDKKDTLLYRMLHHPAQFDQYIIVGGYMYEQLQQIIESDFPELGDKIVLVQNENYMKYGSGFSFYCGLKAAMETNFDEIIFAEGDLFVDSNTFVKLCHMPKNVVTCNQEPIVAKRAVAFYFDKQNQIHYIYDTNHSRFVIDEPFLAIYNSGQIWKFVDSVLLRNTFSSMSREEWQGTNLVLIEKYFQQLKKEDFEIIQFEKWINCNTIEDFKRIEKGK